MTKSSVAVKLMLMKLSYFMQLVQLMSYSSSAASDCLTSLECGDRIWPLQWSTFCPSSSRD